MKILDRLFNKDSVSAQSEQLSQDEREAIADLLLLTIAVQNGLSLDEDRVLAPDSPALGWDSGIEFDRYRQFATSRAEEAQSNGEQHDEYLRSAAERLQSGAGADIALSLLRDLFVSDAESVESTSFYRKVAERLRA